MDDIVELKKENTRLRNECAKLELVAAVAATCTIDLNANLNSAHEEYMEGKIPNGAFQHVMIRHGNMYKVLHFAGYTEKHPIYGYPTKPENENESEEK